MKPDKDTDKIVKQLIWLFILAVSLMLFISKEIHGLVFLIIFVVVIFNIDLGGR